MKNYEDEAVSAFHVKFSVISKRFANCGVRCIFANNGLCATCMNSEWFGMLRPAVRRCELRAHKYVRKFARHA